MIQFRKRLTKKNAILTIISITLVTVLFAFLATKVGFTYDHERYFSKESEDFKIYNRYKTDFLSNDTRTIIAIELENNLLDYHTLSRLKSLTDSLDKLEFVEHVISIDQLKYALKLPFGIMRIPVINIEKPEGYASDSIRLVRSNNVVGGLVDSTFRIITIQVFSKYNLDKAETDTYTSSIHNTLLHFGFNQTFVGGRIVTKAHILDRMKIEMGTFILISFFLVLLVLALVFRSVWGIAVPLIIVIFTAIWTLGLMSLFGKELDVLSSLIPSILFIVGISDVIHIYNNYLNGIRNAYNKKDAIYFAYKKVGKATFITSVTTSIGFLSLMIATLPPMQEFGIYTAVGVIIAFLLSFSLFPAFLMLLPVPNVKMKKSINSTWDLRLEMVYNWVFKRKRSIIISSIVLTILCLFGASQLKIDSYLTEELPKSDPLKQSNAFFAKHFGGSRTFDLAIQLKDTTKSIFDYDIVKQIERVEDYLRTEYKVSNMISPVLLVKECNMMYSGGGFSFNRIPEKEKYAYVMPTIQQFQTQKYFESICHQNLKEARISGNMMDEGGYILLQKNEALMRFCASESSDLKVNLIGTSHFYDVNSRATTLSLLRSLSLALLIIGLLMALLYKSPRMIVIAIIPNLLPLLLISLVMYLSNIDLKVVTALIFTVAFGITVDDTIHLLASVNIHLKKGEPLHRALKHSYMTTGKSIILTTIILFFGFISLTISSFTASFYFGLLISLGLLFALIVDLTLLPALLLVFSKKK